MTVAKKLVVGSSLRLITLVANIIVAFFMLPFMLDSLGDRAYGMWVIIGSIISFYGMFDLGLSSATQRFFAYVLPSGDEDELNRVLSTSFVLFFFVGIIALVVTLLGAASAPLFLDQNDDISLFVGAFTIIGIGVAISFPFYVFNGVLTANLRYDFSCYVQLFKLTLRTFLFVYLLKNNASIVELAIATVVADVFGYVLLFVSARKLAPWMKIRYSSFDKLRMKDYFNYGGYAVLSSASDNARHTVDSFILGATVGLATVAHYNVAAQLAIYIQKAINSIFGVMTPIFTSYHSRGEKEVARERLIFVTKLAVIVSVMAGGVIASVGGVFITLWVGEEFRDSYYPLVILTACSVIVGMQIPSTNLLFAMAKHKLYALLNVVEVLVNVIISFSLVESYGMVGVAFGSLIPLICIRLAFQPIYLSRQLNMDVMLYYSCLLGALLAAIVVQVPFFFYVRDYTIITSYYDLFEVLVLYYPLAAIVLFVFVFNKGEKSMLLAIFRRKAK